MKSILDRLFRTQRRSADTLDKTSAPSGVTPDISDVEDTGFPLVPDDYHLLHVGKTKQGNGYWIDLQHAQEEGGTRDFVVAYVFDRAGDLISSDVMDQGLRPSQSTDTTEEIVRRLMEKIDAQETAQILVKPFSISFYGHRFGLVVRQKEDGENSRKETLVDVLPSFSLMFYGPWDKCNYDS